MTLPLTDPALTKLGKQTLKHRYVVSPQVPVNLMGRDLLIKLGATIMCSSDGLSVTLPGGKSLPCLETNSKNQYLMQNCEPPPADIYWGRLVEEGILGQYQQWKPWIMSLAVYSSPRDPFHVTLFYDRDDDDVYREAFQTELEGPTDVGLANCSPVLFQLKSDTPISRPQYKHKPEAEEGIAETIEGGRQFRYTRLPQGFALSPGIFNQVLKEALSPCQLPEGCTLIQYVDDLLIAAPSAAACSAASLIVLRRLSECGFKRLSKVLEAPNLTFTHEGINMAELMGSGEPHDCAKKAEVEGKVREDLKAEPISGAEDWFTDGCCHRDEEGLKAGYAIVCKQGTEFEVKEAERIEGQQSAQRAEVIALSRALRLAKDKRVNIYTDSAYAFGAAHVELAQWKRAGFRTATNAPICHRKEMEELERALHDPSEVSIIKCKGHSQANTMVAKGNQKADEAAKEAAGYKGRQQMVQVTAEEEAGINMLEEAKQAQEEASLEEKEVWQSKGARKEGGLWRGADGRPVLTDKLARQKITEAHGLGHVTSGLQTVDQVTPEVKAVWLKVIKRKWKEPRWTGPYEVIARTTTAVQLKGKGDTWYHWSQCAPAHESLVEENSSTLITGVNDHEQRQNKSSHLCNGPTSSLPGRPKKEEQQLRRSPRQKKGAGTPGHSFEHGGQSSPALPENVVAKTESGGRRKREVSGPWDTLPKAEIPGGVFYLVIGVDVTGIDPFGVIRVNLVDPQSKPLAKSSITTLIDQTLTSDTVAQKEQEPKERPLLTTDYTRLKPQDLIERATGFKDRSVGTCAMVRLGAPLMLIGNQVKTTPEHNTRTLAARRKRHILAKRGTQGTHAYDPRLNSPTWIDSIGVPRGVPDEYKLVNPIAAGFESIFLWVTPNKNVDRINYVHYNLLRLSNLTRDAMVGFAEQLGPSSLMGVQNRMALDMLLAEKGGVCAMFGDMCCTFIPNNTAPDGSVTRALEGLKTLSETMHEHSGIENPLVSWMTSVFGRWKGVAIPKRAEVNFLPNFPQGKDPSSLDQLKQAIVEEVKKAEKNLPLIRKLMETTFPLRRQTIVMSCPPVKELLDLWPALKMESELYAEFQRITNQNLPNTFYAELDRHLPRLMTLFRQKASKTGKTADALAEILRIHDEQDIHDIHTKRTTVPHALPVYLREDVSGFFRTCTDESDELELDVVKVALFTVISDHDTTSPVHYQPVKTSVVIESDAVVSLPRFGEAFLVMFGLIYALHLSYPKALTNTLEFTQKILLGLESGKLSPRLQTLKNDLVM
ncbi:butyrophilin [Sarotherodon galilaeus]